MNKQDLAAYMQGREYLVGILGLIFYLRWADQTSPTRDIQHSLNQADQFLCIWEERSKTQDGK